MLLTQWIQNGNYYAKSRTNEYHKEIFMNNFLQMKEQRKDLEPDRPFKYALYIHTPYCKTKCKYCKWRSDAIGTFYHIANDHWEKVVQRQLEEFKPIFDQIIFDEVYFGGGTPTLVAPPIMRKLFDAIPNFREIPNKCIECSPNTLDIDHIDLLKEYKFQYLSMGIQSLDYEICSNQNRAYLDKEVIKTMIKFIRKEYPGLLINLDLICFLNHGDIRDIPQFARDLKYCMNEIRPDFITVHQEHYTMQSIEKTRELCNMIKSYLEEYPQWSCVNTDLDHPTNDAIYRAEYKLASNYCGYMHHLWDKYNLNLKNDYAVLSLGSIPKFPLKSFYGDMIYQHENHWLTEADVPYSESMFNQLYEFRKQHEGEWNV